MWLTVINIGYIPWYSGTYRIGEQRKAPLSMCEFTALTEHPWPHMHSREEDEGSDKKIDLYSHGRATYACLMSDFAHLR